MSGLPGLHCQFTCPFQRIGGICLASICRATCRRLLEHCSARNLVASIMALADCQGSHCVNTCWRHDQTGRTWHDCDHKVCLLKMCLLPATSGSVCLREAHLQDRMWAILRLFRL